MYEHDEEAVSHREEDVAIVGIAGRFPGAADTRAFWRNLCEGVESIRPLSVEEMVASGVDPAALQIPGYVAAGAPLEDADAFDGPFFGIHPREAELMDPQHRIFLECCWTALEDAGYDPERYDGLIGVFGGVARNTYLLQNAEVYRDLLNSGAVYDAIIGSDKDFPATRVSYKLNLRGPSINVQSACSTSGVAIHLACQSILNGECDMALAGGARIRVPLRAGYVHIEGGIPSPDGHCRAFDAEAAGTVFGSGAAVVVLKRAVDAIRDGDAIYSVIRGSAVNNDGGAKVGYTAPSVEGQAQVIEAALAVAEVDASSISYVEAHGTGTSLGDPIEIAALTKAYRQSTGQKGACAVGAVKTNIGHLDAGAGATGVIKTSLMLRHGKLVPSLNFRTPNPQIDFASSPFYVNTEFRDWKSPEPRRAGVSSFGMGGTNVHLILEQAPAAAPSSPAKPWTLLALSARTEGARAAAADRLAAHLRENPDPPLSDVAYTLHVGRKSFRERCIAVCSDREDAIRTLEERHPRRVLTATCPSRKRAVAMMFPGGGTQYPNMGLELYQTESVYRETIDECVRFVESELSTPLSDLLFPTAEKSEAAALELERPSLALPALFMTEYAMGKLWMSWGIRPSVMIGHSMGEYAAACFSGVMTLREALGLVHLRGRLFEKLPEGGMMSVPLSEAEVEPLLGAELSFAAINHPSRCVVSGPTGALARLADVLAGRELECQRLHISVAAHSAMVEPVLEEFGEYLRGIRFGAPRIPFLSNVTGTWITEAEARDPAYWVRHLRSTVRFSGGLDEVFADPDALLIEVGPGQTLCTFARQHPRRAAGQEVVASMRHPKESTPDLAFLLQSLGRLWLSGVEIDWTEFHARQGRRRVNLPGYPFERKRYWLTPAASTRAEVRTSPAVAAEVGNTNPDDDHLEVPSMSESRSQRAPSTADRKERILGRLKELLNELSGLEPDEIDIHATFLELGFESLFLTQASGAFRNEFEVEVTLRQLIEKTPSLDALADYLDEALPPEALPEPIPEPEAREPQVAGSTRPVEPAPAVAAATDHSIPAPLSAPSGVGSSASLAESVIARQLEIMAQQLEVLRGGQMASPGRVASPEPAAPAPRSQPPAAAREPAGAAADARAPSAAPRPAGSKESAQSTARHGPWMPVDRSAGTLTPRQQAHLDRLVARLNERTAGSKRWTQSRRARLADPRTALGFRLLWKDLVYPVVVERSSGSRVWDVDGNEYLDITMGFGADMLGHSPPYVIEAVEKQLRKGVEIGPQTPLAGEVAELVCELTGMERAAFCNTGSEAVLAAIRIARTVTGRSRIVTFSGDYHGIFDEVLGKSITVRGERRTLPVAPGIPRRMVEDVLILDYGARESLDAIREQAADLAAVVVEPVQSRNPDLQPREFLHALRELTEREDIPLVFDEMITGFRIHQGGAQAWFGVQADIATYGKAIGGGFPIGVIAGKARYLDALDGGMWRYGDDSVPEVGVTWFAGTFVRHPIAMAAASAALRHMKERGPALQEELNARVDRVVRELNEHCRSVGAPIRIRHFSSFFQITFDSHQEFSSILSYYLREKGVHLVEGRAAFFSTAHTDEDMDTLIRVFKECVDEMQEGGFLPEPGPGPGGRSGIGHPVRGERLVVAGSPGWSDGPMPPTESQREILRTCRLGAEASCAYNLTHSLDFKGKLDEPALRAALDRLVARHDAFRLAFSEDGTSMRLIPRPTVTLPVTDLTGVPAGEQRSRIEEVLHEESHRPFDLSVGPLFRAQTIRLGEAHTVVVLTLHHLVCDGFSARTVLRELGALYGAAHRRVDAGLPPTVQYTEYAEWQEKQKQTAAHRDAEAYWVNQHSRRPPLLELPTDRPRPALRTFACGEEVTILPHDQVDELRHLGGQEGCTLFSILLANLNVLLHRLSGQEEIIVGTPASGQSMVESQTLVGHCVSLHPFRSAVDRRATLKEYLAGVQNLVFENYEHRNYTFGYLLDRLELPDDSTRPPLISVQFNLEPRVMPLEFDGLEVKNAFHRDFHSVDLCFNLAEHDDGMHVKLWYNSQLFDPATARGWLGGYIRLLDALSCNLASRVEEIELDVAAPPGDPGSRPLLARPTDGQTEIWLASQLGPEASCVFNLPYTFRMKGRLNLEALKESLRRIVARHEALRARFEPDGQRVEIARSLEIELPCVDLSALDRESRDKQLDEILARELRTPFDLEAGPLVRARIVRTAEDQHELVLTFQHVVCDGLSFRVVARELAAIYSSLCRDTGDGLERPARFVEFAREQESRKRSSSFAESERFWLDQYRELPPALDLPGDRSRLPGMVHRYGDAFLELDSDLFQRVVKCAGKNGATRFVFTLAAYQVLLSRLTGQRDIVVGFPAALPRNGGGDLVGHSVNLLPVRAYVDPELPFTEFLKRSSALTLDAFGHLEFTFGALLQKLKFARDPSQVPLVSAVFSLEQDFDGAQFEGLEVKIRSPDKMFGTFDLEFFLTLSADGIRIRCHYNADRFRSETIARWLKLYRNLLVEICSAPSARIGELPLLDDASRRQLLLDWNRGRGDYPRDAPVHRLFEEQARRRPESVALEFGDEQLTYAELDGRANRVANHLRRLGVGPDVMVGISMERSVEMVVGILGILKAGGAYVPLDPDYPRERLEYMISDTRTPVLLTQSRLAGRLPSHDARLVLVDTDWPVIAAESSKAPASGATSENVAYVIYTSGSTGKPKGTTIPHRAVARLVKNTNFVELGPQEVFLQFAPISFDASTFELWGSLLNGSKLVVFPPQTPSLEELGGFIEARGITTLWLTAALFAQMVDSQLERLRGVRQLLAGGDVLSVPHVKKALAARSEGQTLINGYGPTENTTFTCCHVMERASQIEQSVPIGRPVSNTTVYVLDESMQPAPVGVPGELYTGGDGLAREYWNQPALTAEKFVRDPFGAEPGGRLYRTGDLCRWREDGTLEFLGRRDSQVKIRGFRVELGEIESVLNEHPSVSQAAAMIREDDPGDRRLVAYVVPEDGARLDESDLREYLVQRLPSYMMPSAFVMIDALPLSPSGKVDRDALPVPDRERDRREYIAPRTPIEEKLAAIWCEVLHLDRLGVDENFFEVGGHSLLAMRMISRLRNEFELSLSDLFEHPTISGLARKLEAQEEAGEPPDLPLVPVSREGALPLSFAQQRLWFLSLLEPESPFYNVPVTVVLEGPLEVEPLEYGLREILRRHEVLRATFGATVAEPPFQVVGAECPFELRVVDLGDLPAAQRDDEMRRLAREEVAVPFDLAHAPLCRASLFRKSAEEHLLVLVIHHIACDEWSIDVLLKELAALYDARRHGQPASLPDLPVQYADYAVWQREWLQGGELERQLSYWKEQLAGLRTLELPTDHPRPSRQTFRGAREDIVLPKTLSEELRALSRRETATLFMTMLAAFQALLARYTGQEDLVLGSPISNRNRKEVEGLIGMFVNTLVLRTDASGDPSFRELLRRVRDMALDAYAHRDMPLEKLVEELQPERDMSRNPLFQVLFVLRSPPRISWRTPGLRASFRSADVQTTHMDLEVFVSDRADGLNISIVYNVDLFEATTIRRLLGHYATILAGAAAEPECRLSALPLLSGAEREALVGCREVTRTDYPRDATIPELFEEQVRQRPGAVALALEGEELSYAELDSRANRVANHLRRLGVGADVMVGICTERSIEMVVGILGILKAGGAYVPLDPGYPEERLDYMISDARTPVLLTHSRLVDRLPKHDAQVVCLDADWPAIAGESSEAPRTETTAENLAYAIYTSGSTGRPKGTTIPHRAVARLVKNTNFVELGPDEVFLQFAPISFDASTFELWGSLLNGSKLVLFPPHAPSLEELGEFIETRGITTLWLTAALFAQMVDAQLERLHGVRQLLAGGDVLSVPHVRKALAARGEGQKLINGYGPTENTTFTCCHLMDRTSRIEQTVPIGRPISNTTVYLLDERMRPVPVGVAGELYTGGDGLAREYLNQPALTAEKFVSDPFSEESGARLYRTGDLARYRSDGSIEFLGRRDSQVKIRGFRVELGEVESALNEHEHVSQVAAVVREDDPGDRRLVAYVVPGSGGEPDANVLREHLRQRLPAYMLPSAFVMIDALPLSPSGKVDRSALPAPDREQGRGDYVAPRTPTEETLAAMWCQVLGLDRVGVNEDFFELGGHSLLATQVVSLIRAKFEIDMPLALMFEQTTLGELASSLDLRLLDKVEKMSEEEVTHFLEALSEANRSTKG